MSKYTRTGRLAPGREGRRHLLLVLEQLDAPVAAHALQGGQPAVEGVGLTWVFVVYVWVGMGFGGVIRRRSVDLHIWYSIRTCTHT